jgi:hypothetical protein
MSVEFQNKRKRTNIRNVYPLLNYIPSGIMVCIWRQQESEKEKLLLLCETGRWARKREVKRGWRRRKGLEADHSENNKNQ